MSHFFRPERGDALYASAARAMARSSSSSGNLATAGSTLRCFAKRRTRTAALMFEDLRLLLRNVFTLLFIALKPLRKRTRRLSRHYQMKPNHRGAPGVRSERIQFSDLPLSLHRCCTFLITSSISSIRLWHAASNMRTKSTTLASVTDRTSSSIVRTEL